MKGKPTSFDIAYKAGVSQATVSRALRDSPLVSEETRRKVKAIAKEINYKVDKHASSLRRQQAQTLAVLLFEDPTSDDSLINPFFMSMLASITRSCARAGYDLLISFQQLSDDWHADYQDSHKADGLILLGYGDYLTSESKLAKLAEQGTHFVRWGPSVPGQAGLTVGCDNVQGGRLLTDHLIKLGRRAIAFIGDASLHCPEFLDRHRGYSEAMRAAKVRQSDTLLVPVQDSTEQVGFEAMTTLIATGKKFDAVFAASDLLAIGAMRALTAAGRSVPDDVAVVGFDDIPMASFSNPPLTTVAQDTRVAGELLVATLIQAIEKKAVESVMLPARLVVRRSSGSPR